jgi:enoyl-CoA hydratase/carnithine racemase
MAKVLYEKRNRIGYITLNRPAVDGNAIMYQKR